MIDLTLEMLEMTLEITAAGDQHTVTLIREGIRFFTCSCTKDIARWVSE